jgi:hypothetical protein
MFYARNNVFWAKMFKKARFPCVRLEALDLSKKDVLAYLKAVNTNLKQRGHHDLRRNRLTLR